MSERKWTKSQKEAIDFRGKNLILSAAAGSGKTATLTERIIRLIKDTESGADLRRMLIVTFTVAAAGELRERIAAALNEAIAKDPDNASLIRQLSSLEGAHISTIDSFFKSELRPYFNTLGLPPEFSMLDEAEAAVLRKEAMEDTLSAFFEGRGETSVEDFKDLADCLSDARSESDLCEKLSLLSSSLLSRDISTSDLEIKAKELSEKSDDFMKTDYALPIIRAIKRASDHYEKRFSILEAYLSENEDTEKYVPEASRLARLAKELSDLCDKPYTEVKYFFDTVEFSSLSPLKKDKQTDEYVTFKDLRGDFKKQLSAYKEDFFSSDTEILKKAIDKTARLVSTLAKVNEHFLSVYGEAKRERGAVDFSDLGIFARKIFSNPDGTPTKAALEVGEKYDFIFIDEYQDTNPVQDAVFSAVSKNAGRFMVGDVKQSIYGFRGSCPQLFTDYRNLYANGEEGTAVFMSENFRSDKCVIDFSNAVSRHIFSTGHTPFDKEDELVCSKSGGESENVCEVILVEKESENEEELPSEAQCVAARISRILAEEKLSDGSPVKPKDIAILLRSGVNAEEFARELSRLGIPVNNSASEDFFDYGEVLLVLCLLNATDNPLRDIYLAGAMKSPLFGFTLNDLINIRRSTSVPLWYSLIEYCTDGEDDKLKNKCTSFCNTLDRWREAAKELYCDEVLRLIVSDTDLRNFGGDGSRDNADIVRSLKILSDQAAAVAKRGGTLHEFIAYLNSVIERKDKAGAFSDPDSVSILTIHKSKGLEYPVCFICEASKKFNMRDSTEKMLLDKTGLVGAKLYDESAVVRCDNPLRRAVSLQMNENTVEEEARVLYVAMTRAREKLIVTCKVKSAADRLEKSGAKACFPLSVHEVLSASTYTEWITDAIKREGDGSFFVYKKGTDISAVTRKDVKEAVELKDELLEFFEKALDFSYDKEYLWNIPAKLSVSVLKPDILGSEEENDYFDRRGIISMEEDTPLPVFLREKKEADGAARGTATHVFMQFCDFENLQKNGADAELSRLVEKQFILREDASLVRLDEIGLFLNSELFKNLLSAPFVLRERRFNTLLPAKDFTTDPSLRETLERDGVTITVQGVVDCIYTDCEGNTVLVDYKTDRLTKEELENEDLASKKLLAKHSRQLKLYSSVCEKMMGKPFDRVLIYSLPLGKTIEVE